MSTSPAPASSAGGGDRAARRVRPGQKLGPCLGLFAAAAIALGGCGGSNAESAGALNYAENAQRAYQRAMEVFRDKDYEEAKALFREVRRKYSYSRFARLAELRIADADFESEKLAEAVQEYRAFVHDHRADEEVPYARYRIAETLYDQISDTIFLPPQEERDQAATGEAYRELKGFVKDYPKNPHYSQAFYMLQIVTGRLVRHELYVARFYLKRDNFDAAVNRIQYALETYRGSYLDPEALVLLGQTYLQLHRREQARQTFEQVLAEYPSSAFAVPARNFLDQIRGESR